MPKAFKPRNREKTRSAILDAARSELTRKGYAGARMEAIAKAAGVTKELIYHYFKGKEAIFEEVRALQRMDSMVAEGDTPSSPTFEPDGDPGRLFAWRFHKAVGEPEWVKLLTWEAAQGTATNAPSDALRRSSIGASVKALEQAQAEGRASAEFDPRLVQLAVFALATYPLAYAQITSMTTGRAPTDPAFRAEWSAFLEQLGHRILGPQAPQGD